MHAVKSRWLPDPKDVKDVGVACLKLLHVDFVGDGPVPSLQDLVYLREAGLRVDVFCPSNDN